VSIGRVSLPSILCIGAVDTLPFGVTIPATVLQRSEFTGGLMNYPVYLIFGGNDKFASNIKRGIKCKIESNVNQEGIWDLELWSVKLSVYIHQ
jgi:hypothetical protein